MRRENGDFVDIGGSTGGYTRTAVYDWHPPDVTDFRPVDPDDL